MVEDSFVLLEDVWKDRVANPTDDFYKKINAREFLEEDDLLFLKKYFSKTELESNLSTEHLLYLKSEKLIDWFLLRNEWLLKNKEVNSLKRQLLQLEKDVDMLKIGKEKSFLEI